MDKEKKALQHIIIIFYQQIIKQFLIIVKLYQMGHQLSKGQQWANIMSTINIVSLQKAFKLYPLNQKSPFKKMTTLHPQSLKTTIGTSTSSVTSQWKTSACRVRRN